MSHAAASNGGRSRRPPAPQTARPTTGPALLTPGPLHRGQVGLPATPPPRRPNGARSWPESLGDCRAVGAAAGARDGVGHRRPLSAFGRVGYGRSHMSGSTPTSSEMTSAMRSARGARASPGGGTTWVPAESPARLPESRPATVGRRGPACPHHRGSSRWTCCGCAPARA